MTTPPQSGGPAVASGARGMLWQGAATAVGQVIQAVCALLVAGAAGPTQYALWGLVTIVLNLHPMVATITSPALIYLRDEGEAQDLLDTAVVLNLGLTLLVGLVLHISAPLVVGHLTQGLAPSEAVLALRISVIAFACSSATSVPQALLEKQLRFSRRAAPELICSLIYAGLVLALLAGGHGVWSLIIAKSVQSLLMLGLFWWAAPMRPRVVPRMHLGVLKRILGYARLLLGSSMLTAVFGNVDTVFMGLVGGAVAIGAYSFAYSLATLIPTFLALSLGKVFFPLYAEARERPSDLRDSFATGLHFATIFIVPPTLGLLLLGPSVINTLVGDKWKLAGPLLRILAFYGLFRVAAFSGNLLASARGRTDLVLKTEIIGLVVAAALSWPLSRLGMWGIAMAFAVGQACAGSYALWGTRQLLSWTVWAQSLRPWLIGGIALVLPVIVQAGIREPSLWSLPLIIFAVSYPLLVLILDPHLRQALRLLPSATKAAATTPIRDVRSSD